MFWCQDVPNIGLSNHKLKSALKCAVWSQWTPVPDRRTDRRTNSALVVFIHDSYLFSTVYNIGPSLMNFTFFWRPAICMSIMYFHIMFSNLANILTMTMMKQTDKQTDANIMATNASRAKNVHVHSALRKSWARKQVMLVGGSQCCI